MDANTGYLSDFVADADVTCFTLWQNPLAFCAVGANQHPEIAGNRLQLWILSDQANEGQNGLAPCLRLVNVEYPKG